jgi:hypothetical protein
MKNLFAVKTLQVLNWLFFFGMVYVNFLAVSLPLNGKSTGALSNQYPNLFVPAPITFSIWGIIYLLLLIFCIRQSKGLLSKISGEITDKIVRLIGFRFILTCVLNATWIFVWHYEYVGTSVVVMLLFLAQLISINQQITFSANGSLFTVKAPFGIYLGWICVATVANTTAFLVNIRWDRIGQSEVFWTCLLIVIAACIIAYTLTKLRNFYIGLVVIWAFYGIINARLSAEVYQRFVVWTAVFGIGLVAIMTIIEIRRAWNGKYEAKTF